MRGVKIIRRCAVVILSVALLIGCGRLVVVVASTETGWETIRLQLKDATVGWLGLEHEQIDRQEPKSQANYWISAVDESQHGESAALSIGAAWVLDSPGHRFIQNHLQQSEHAAALPQFGLSLNQEAIDAAKAAFEEQCHTRCLSLANRATKIEPTDERWWRMRALLQFNPDTQEPRHEHWLATLDECSANDPENALYDYLAALSLWTSSADYDWPDEDGWPEDEFRLTVRNPKIFEQGIRRFNNGQSKLYVAIGEDGFPAVAGFLNSTRLPKVDQAEIAVSRMVTYRQSRLFYQLWRWLGARTDNAKQSGKTDEQIGLSHQRLRMFDQFVKPDETSAMDKLVKFDSQRRYAFNSLIKLMQDNVSSTSLESIAQLRENEKQLRVEAIVLKDALSEWDAAKKKAANAMTFGSVLATVSLVSTTCLAMFAMCALAVKKMFQAPFDRRNVQFGVIRHGIAWIIGCGCTFVLLGMAPAELVSHKIQSRIITLLVWLTALLAFTLVLWCIYLFLKRRRFQFSLRSLLGVTLGAAILASFWPIFRSVFAYVDANPPELWLHAKGWSGIDAEVWRTTMKLNKGSWLWATLQWFAHSGQHVGLVASLSIVAAWFSWRQSRSSDEGILNYWTRNLRERWPLLIGCVGTSAMVAALFCLTIYVWSAPTLVHATETDFQYKMRYCRDPGGHRSQIQAVRDKMLSSDKRNAID